MALTKTPLHRVQSVHNYQSRAGRLNEELVAEYAELYKSGKEMPPIDVCGSTNMGFFIVDGFHRHEGMKVAGYKGETEVMVNVVDGRVLPAVVKWLASSANKAHGLRRTNEDKRRAVEMALEAMPEQSDGAIAEHVGVTREYVQRTRPQVAIKSQPEKRTGIDGKQYPAPPPLAPKAPQPKAAPPAPTAPPKAADEEGATHIPPAPATAPAGNQAAKTPPPPSRTGITVSKKRDELNRPIPEDLQPHWNRRGELMSHLAKLKEIQRALINGRQERDALYAQVTQETVAYSTNVINAVEDCMPYAVCPWCGGMNPGCNMCGNRGGFVSKFQIERFAKTDAEIWKRVSPVAVEAEG